MEPVKLIFLLTMALCVNACTALVANLPDNDELLREHTQQDGRECIRDSDIRGFGVLDRDLISVDSRNRDEYFLMTTLFRCHSLELSPRVAFVGNYAEFCSGNGNKIHTGEEACPIKSIFKFESREQAFEAYEEITEKRAQLRKELTDGQ